MSMNSWLQKFHGTQKIMACHDKYYYHKFKTHKNLAIIWGNKFLIKKWYINRLNTPHEFLPHDMYSKNGILYFH
jgi:hypothetical protein